MGAENDKILALRAGGQRRACVIIASFSLLIIRSFFLRKISDIRGAFHRKTGPVQDVGIDHGGGNIGMPQQLLHCADVQILYEWSLEDVVILISCGKHEAEGICRKRISQYYFSA